MLPGRKSRTWLSVLEASSFVGIFGRASRLELFSLTALIEAVWYWD